MMNLLQFMLKEAMEVHVDARNLLLKNKLNNIVGNEIDQLAAT